MTPQELYEAVLIELGQLAAGESAQPEDIALVTDRYSALYEMLSGKRLVSWAEADDVPGYAQLPVIWMLAYMLCGPFQVNSIRTQELKLKGALDLSPRQGGPSEAESQLRRQLARTHVAWPAQSEYF